MNFKKTCYIYIAFSDVRKGGIDFTKKVIYLIVIRQEKCIIYLNSDK